MDGTHKPPPSLPIETIKGVKFTPREIDVLACILGGRATKKIASFLSVSSKTVENHIYHIMLKLECNSRESIKDFLEGSDEILFLKNHYERLSFQEGFERKLKEISAHNLQERPRCLLIYGVENKNNTSLFSQLEKHLKLAGVIVALDVRKETWTENTLREAVESASQDFRLLFIPQALKESLQIEKNKSKKIIPQFFEEEAKQQKTFLFLLRAHNKKTFIHFPEFSPCQHKAQKDYYLSLIEILKNLFPKYNFDSFLSIFEKLYENIENSLHLPKKEKHTMEGNKKNNFNTPVIKNIKSGISILALFFIIICVYWKFDSDTLSPTKQGEHSIRSDLMTPQKNVLLDRPEIIAAIDKALTAQNDIQTVALVGTGGAGKTTLARHYAQQQKTNIMWEINVETQQTLKNSFEKLARHLAKTEEEQKVLRAIQDIKIFKEKEEKIIEFVKEHLKLSSNWFLIYDNVEHFSDIQKYFPHDYKSWGNGKIILTTRNTNIQNNSQVSRMVPIGELTQEQKLELFTKIISHGVPSSITTQRTETIKFLASIPPFPLDISVAAYYLKSTNMSYKKYLENLENYNKDFDSVQKNLLKEAGTYLKTRYTIITQSLEYLIKNHKEFEELLLFASLLDSQNIPRDLLNKHKSEPIVDNFIYHLKKYSLITNSADSALGPTISLHRSTQAIILAYLIKKLNLNKEHKVITLLSDRLIKYAIYLIEEDNFPKLEGLIIQYNAFLNHENLLSTDIEASIKCVLGNMFCHLSYITKSKSLIEDNISKLKKNYAVLAPTLLCLGIVAQELRNPETAKKLVEQSLLIYEKHLPENHIGYARALVYLGEAYRLLEDYEKAKKSLEKAIAIYNKHSINHYGIAAALTYLGLIYKTLDLYEKSLDLFEQALAAYKKIQADHHIGFADVLGHMGNTYKNLGDEKKAKDYLEQSLTAFKQLFSENHVRIAWSSLHLGDAYYRLGEYDKAKILFEKSLIIYKKHYNEDSDWVSRVLLKLGVVEKELGNLERAKGLLEAGLQIHKKNYSERNANNIIYLIQLGNFYSSLGMFEEAKLAFAKSLDRAQKKGVKNNPRGNSKILLQMGDVHKNLENYTLAEKYFKEVLVVHKKYYGDAHSKTAHVLKNLGEVYLLKGELEPAEIHLINALKIFEQTKHPDIYKCFECLAELYQKKFEVAKRERQENQAQNFKSRAANYLNQALEIVKNHFPANSPHIIRIQDKIKKSCPLNWERPKVYPMKFDLYQNALNTRETLVLSTRSVVN